MTLDINDKNLETFREWLLDAGRSEGTAQLYVSNLRQVVRAGGPTKRLTSSELSANTLHTNKAALAAWALFTEDADLAKKVKRTKLPPAVRVKPKRELEKADWKTIAAAIKDSRSSAPVKACLLIMARRGLRSGDVLRLQKSEVLGALRTGVLTHEVKGRRRLEFAAAPVREALELLAAERGAWRRVEDLVTSTKREGIYKRRIAAQHVGRHLRSIAKKAGIAEVHPHRLRRTYAVHYLKALAGDPRALVKLQHHMGWANMMTALAYVDSMEKGELDQRGIDLVAELDA